MPHSIPTPAQTRLLQLLGEFEYLTTRQVWEYLAAPVTKRAIEQKLQRLERYGLIRSGLLNPERGNASERRWSLVTKGADACNEPGTADLVQGQRVSATGSQTLTAPHVAVVQLLAEMKHLSTTQIHKYLHANRPKWYTWQLLRSARRHGYVRSEKLYPERGAASEHYWTLTGRGAALIGTRFDTRYRRRLTRQVVEHRGLLLELVRQVEGAGWSLLRPHPHRTVRGELIDTPQRSKLVEVVLRSEQLAIEDLLQRGYPPGRLQDRIDRLKAGKVGAIVPRPVNDYLAFLPGQPDRTVLLIPHPPLAGRAFWTRRPGIRRASSVGQARTEARIVRYSRLAQVIPVMAVFAREEELQRYDNILAGAGFRRALVKEIGEKLAGTATP
jgi:hypothetical protein